MVHDFMMKFHNEGVWNVSHQEIKDATSNMWDMLLDNIEYCDGYRFIYNNYEWCMDNMETCKFHQGIATRIIEHGFELIGNALQISHTWGTDSTCYEDSQMLNKIGLISEGITKNISTVVGFEGTWDRTAEMEHLSFHQMHKNIKEKKKHTPRPHEECPIKTIMEYFFGPEVAAMQKELIGTIGSLFPHPQKTHH